MHSLFNVLNFLSALVIFSINAEASQSASSPAFRDLQHGVTGYQSVVGALSVLTPNSNSCDDQPPPSSGNLGDLGTPSTSLKFVGLAEPISMGETKPLEQIRRSIQGSDAPLGAGCKPKGRTLKRQSISSIRAN
jgi:hypothetical protein